MFSWSQSSVAHCRRLDSVSMHWSRSETREGLSHLNTTHNGGYIQHLALQLFHKRLNGFVPAIKSLLKQGFPQNCQVRYWTQISQLIIEFTEILFQEPKSSTDVRPRIRSRVHARGARTPRSAAWSQLFNSETELSGLFQLIKQIFHRLTRYPRSVNKAMDFLISRKRHATYRYGRRCHIYHVY